MLLRVWLICLCSFCFYQIVDAQSVYFKRPQDHDILHDERIEIEIGCEDFEIPRDGHAEIYLNGQKAFDMQSTNQGAIVMLKSGWHSLEAVLFDQSGIAVGKDDYINFEIDIIDPLELTTSEHAAGYLPMQRGLVSVIIGSRNRWESLNRTVDSVLQQTYKPIEVIVIDDASSDPRYHQIRMSGGVTVVHMGVNVGKPGLIRNRGIALASGEWVAFVDDDDVWFPTKVEEQVKAMKQHNVNMSSTDALVGHGPYGLARYINQEYSGHLSNMELAKGGPDKTKEWPPYGYPRWLGDLASAASVRASIGEDVLPDRWNRSLIVRGNFHVCSSVMVQRDLVVRVGGFGEAKFAEDYELWKKIMRFTDSIFVREPLTYYQLASDGLAAAWLKKEDKQEL